MSSANKRANGRASDPVLQPVFLVILAHSALMAAEEKEEEEEEEEEQCGRGGSELDS